MVGLAGAETHAIERALRPLKRGSRRQHDRHDDGFGADGGVSGARGMSTLHPHAHTLAACTLIPPGARIVIWNRKFRLLNADGTIGPVPFTLSRKASFAAAELAAEYQLGKSE